MLRVDEGKEECVQLLKNPQIASESECNSQDPEKWIILWPEPCSHPESIKLADLGPILDNIPQLADIYEYLSMPDGQASQESLSSHFWFFV